MNRSVYKWMVLPRDRFYLDLHTGAEILTFQIQQDTACIWALVDPTAKLERRHFRLAGTGQLITEPNLKYIGTVQLEEQTLVFHLFEVEQ